MNTNAQPTTARPTDFIEAMLGIEIVTPQDHMKDAKVSFAAPPTRVQRVKTKVTSWYKSARNTTERGYVKARNVLQRLIWRMEEFLYRHQSTAWILSVLITIVAAALAYVIFILAIIAWWTLITFLFI